LGCFATDFYSCRNFLSKSNKLGKSVFQGWIAPGHAGRTGKKGKRFGMERFGLRFAFSKKKSGMFRRSV
jgi:hypothetical protein